MKWKAKTLSYLTIVLLLSFSFILILPIKAIEIKQNVRFTLSANNTQFLMGADFDFYKVEVNSTHLWMDKTYSTKKYTRYCIYVNQPNDTQLTVNTWFATANSTAKLTIISPFSTNITLGLYSPNLISASATGVVSYSWNSANKTLSMVANTATNPLIIISATVTETSHNIAPENYAIEITDMEGCGNWVFSEESYYTFQAKYWDGDGYSDLDTMKIRFTDGVNTITAVYDQSGEEWSLESGLDVVRLKAGTKTILDSNLLQVTFLIYFQNTILDALNVDILMYCNDTSGVEDDWEIKALNYFNIYNLGGHSTLTSNGDAGRLVGGDVFDLYANRSSWVEASMDFRDLQHAKFLPELFFELSGDYFHIIYGVDYCTVEDDWIEGWELDLYYKRTWESGNRRYTQFEVRWYDKGQLVKAENISMFHRGWYVGNSSVRFWVDLWLNKINASSTWGGRVNAYYFPMTDNSNLWLRWLTGSNWGIYEEVGKESTCFGTLKDNDGNTLYAPQIKMVRIKAKLEVETDVGIPVQWLEIKNYDVFDLTLGGTPLQGIQTPVFDETRVPVMPQGGFLGAIVSGLLRLGAMISEALGPAILGFWDLFVGFLDSVFTYFGWPNGFSEIVSWISSLLTWLVSSFTYLISFLTSAFTLLFTFITKMLNTLANMVGQWVSIIQNIFLMLGGGLGTGIDIWNSLNLSTWVLIIAIFYPIYLVALWEEKGLDAAINHVRMVLDVLAWVGKIFITVIELFLNVIGRIIESIPVIE